MAVKTKPFFVALLICLFIFYSGLFHIPEKDSAVFIFPQFKVKLIAGKIISSPVKTSSGKYYSCSFKLKYAGALEGQLGRAKGVITLYIPTDSVEALFPGSLYSEAQQDHIFETGLSASFWGSCREKGFFASGVKDIAWEASLAGRIGRLRALFRLAFKRMMFSWKGAGGLLLALLCGAREFTESVTADAFRNAGLSHILALSGMHLSLFSGLAQFAGKKMKNIRLAFWLRLGIISIFCWFAGFSPSLLRAFLCALLSILAASAGMPKLKTSDSLCAAFLLQCALCPAHIYNAGFLLSYGALAGITGLSALIHFVFVRLLPQPVSSSLAASLSAQTFTAPLALKLFGTFSPIGIIATMIVSPLVSFFIYSGLALIILSMIIPILQVPSGIFMNFLYTIIKNIVILFSSLEVVIK